jgi:hypothetical protein
MAEKINLDDLYKNKKTTFEHKIKVYEKILARIHKKIKTTARLRNSKCFCMYVVPEFILGLPRYDIGLCISYIMDKLSENGFKIKYTHPNLLFISWGHYIPHYERQEYKKKTGITIDGFGNVVKKNKNKKNEENVNTLLLKNGKEQKINNKKSNFRDISKYKPRGDFIYDNKTIKTLQNITLK